MTLKAKVSKGLKWQAINIVGRQLLSLAVFTTLARLLEPATFGLVGLVGVYLTFVGMFAEQGIGHALIQRQDLEPGHLNAAFWFNGCIAAVLCLATVLLASPVARLFGEPQLAPLPRWSSLSLIITATSEIHGTLFVKAMDFRRPVIRNLLANAAGGLVGVGMALAGYGVWALVGQQLATALTGAIFLWSASPYRPTLDFSLRHLRELFRVSSSVFVSGFLWMAACRIDQIVISRVAGVQALGLYLIANKLPDFAKMVTSGPIGEVTLPALSQLQDDYARMREVIYRGMEIMAVVAFAIFVGLAAVASDLIPLLLGNKWSAAASTCSFLSLYALLTTLTVFFHPALLASGGTGKYVQLNALHAAGVLVVSLITIRFGVPYLAAGLLVNGLLTAIPALLFLRNRMGLSPAAYCRPCIFPALAALFMSGLTLLVGVVLPPDISMLIRLVLKIMAGACGYLGFLFLFQRAMLMKLSGALGSAISSRLSAPQLVP